MREELDNFDPLAELDSNIKMLKDESMDAHQRKSVWKMNYKMKNELASKTAKSQIVQESLLPSVKEIVVDNMW